MALFNCPECGNKVSDMARSCPRCGYPIMNESNRSREANKAIMPVAILFTAVIIIIVLIVAKKNDSQDDANDYSSAPKFSYKYDNDYSKNDSYEKNASAIFSNLVITDFSCSSGKHSGRMTCKVKNNNSFTVHGYFRVNFYDASGSLIYSQLMSLSDVAPGESVVCSTSIPKDDYPDGYKSYDFSQASLVER